MIDISTISMEAMHTLYCTARGGARMEVAQAEQRLFRAEFRFGAVLDWLLKHDRTNCVAERMERHDNPQPTLTPTNMRGVVEHIQGRQSAKPSSP